MPIEKAGNDECAANAKGMKMGISLEAFRKAKPMPRMGRGYRGQSRMQREEEEDIAWMEDKYKLNGIGWKKPINDFDAAKAADYRRFAGIGISGRLDRWENGKPK